MNTKAAKETLDEVAAQAGLSRREFMRLAGIGAVAMGATATGVTALADQAGEALGLVATPVRKSQVVIVKHAKVLLSGYKADPGVLNEMITVGLRKLTETKNTEAAWRELFKTNDRVCMKRNGLGGPSIETHKELHGVITDSLSEQVEINPDSVVVWDPKPSGEMGGWSEPFTTKKNNIRSKIVRALSDYGTALINIPILKTHSSVSVTIAMKNHLGTVPNAGDFHHPDGWGGDLGPNIADLNTHPAIKDKTRLIVVDAIRPLYNGGPGENARYRWDYNSLIIGKDPVAVDTVGLRILEAKRRDEQMSNWKLGPGHKYMAYAEQLGLGHAQSKNIQVFRIDLGSSDPKPVELPLDKVG